MLLYGPVGEVFVLEVWMCATVQFVHNASIYDVLWVHIYCFVFVLRFL